MRLQPMFENFQWFSWVILPILIFLARICDVTIGTIRIIFVSRGQKRFASLLGFFEVIIWLAAIGQIMKNLNNIACYIGYGCGFAMGNFIGISLEEKLAMGIQMVRIFTPENGTDLVNYLKEAGYGVTSIDAKGTMGPVNLVYTVIKRSDLDDVVRKIHQFNPKAFYSIEDVRSVNEGIFPAKEPTFIRKHLRQCVKRK
jgi:uncharacterized protein YebE (UPF0316 family)